MKADASDTDITISEFQEVVSAWVEKTMGALVALDPRERNHRFFEEACELVQSCEMSREEAHQLVDYVFSREPGERHQEVGGATITLIALASAHQIDAQHACLLEMSRCVMHADKIRDKQTTKPQIGAPNPLYPNRKKVA